MFSSIASLTGGGPTSIESAIQQAILRGDVDALRTLLGEVASLSANDLAMAQRALAAMENLGAQEAKMLAERYGIDFANKIGHAFGKDGHKLDAVVQAFGSAERAFVEIQGQLDAMSLSAGNSTQILNVGGINVTVQAFVRNGTAKIVNIFIP